MDNTKLQNGLSRIENLIPQKPKENLGALKDDGGFKQALQNVIGNDTAVTDKVAKPNSTTGIKFSNHAIERMQTRGISYNPDSLAKLDQAIQKAAAKGSKDTLVLMDDSALIVSVKNNTVVTVMDKNALKENVFTNIDSTVVI